jgi:ABC-2 type transport system permease protein
LDHNTYTALDDLRQGLLAHRAWRAFAANDVTQRHRRAVLGRLWIVVAMGVTVAAIGAVYAGVMQAAPSQYVPFIAAGLVVWYLISGAIAESSSVFIASEGLIKAIYVPKTFFIARLLYRNLIIFFGNLVVVVITLVLFRPSNLTGLIFVPVGLLLVMINLFWITVLVGVTATRYRDIAPIAGSAMQVLFLLTPVIYKQDQLSAGFGWITYVNPLANLVAVLREPLLGQWPEAARVWICAAMAAAGLVVAFVVFARARARIVLWL